MEFYQSIKYCYFTDHTVECFIQIYLECDKIKQYTKLVLLLYREVCKKITDY